MSENKNSIEETKKHGDITSTGKFAVPSQSPSTGINAVHINNARQMFNVSTRSRYPNGHPSNISTVKNTSRITKSNTSKEQLFSTATTRTTTTSTAATFPTISSATSFSSNTSNTSSIESSDASSVSATTIYTGVTSLHRSDSVDDKFKVSIPAKSHDGDCNNPQCYHCGSVIIPSPASSFPVQDSPSISVNNWEIFTVRKPILNAKEIDMYEERLNLPFPEMIFGKNEVRIQNTEHKWSLVFNSIDALDTVLKIGCDPNKLLKVAHSKHWFDGKMKKGNTNKDEDVNVKAVSAKSKTRASAEQLKLSSDLYNTYVSVEDLNDNVTKMIKPYDWTYTPRYDGTVMNSGETKYEFAKSELEIPISKLKVHDKILFFDDVMLYEDELADNGISVLSCKIRVMQQRMLLLLRFFLRIDDVIFKIRDVRVFIEFQDNLVIRDIKEQEDTYANVYAKASFFSSDGDPRLKLRDSNWVSTHLPVVSHSVEEISFS